MTDINTVSKTNLYLKDVGDICGRFTVPSYQRGYRWGKTEVELLLDDIYGSEGQYCLQPIVVKRNGDAFEVIDGQQRLTTIYLIYRYMNQKSNGFIKEPGFSISYDIRTQSEEFLRSIDASRKEEYIDFWFISTAYECIQEWFETKGPKQASTISRINEDLDKRIKIIWYEVDSTSDSNELFKRLNIGKIPLTDAELVKAMFLSRGSGNDISREKQEEIALQWDDIEKELHNDAFWFFLTNNSGADAQTRIGLILDLISGKKDGEREKYFTFFRFDDMRKCKKLDEIWRKIHQTFLTLKEWFENHELYHKIGYLIAANALSLRKVFSLSENVTKTEFKRILDDEIKKSIECKQNYAELSYEKNADYEKISRLLLLFNVESIRQSEGRSQRFPFDKYKYGEHGRVVWSLEHIHAQQSEGFKSEGIWKEWIEKHIPSIRAINIGGEFTKLVEEMERAVNTNQLNRNAFEEIQKSVTGALSEKGSADYLHSISNLALLNTRDNAALNNSTFDVKRNEIIKKYSEGAFFPFCTMMVFMKAYTPSEKNQLHFWGHEDRVAYIKRINNVLKSYLKEPIVLEKEGL